jgi:PD-(D/E)XK nuclease superfamily
MREITRSSSETFSSCPRKGYWSYIYEGGKQTEKTDPAPLIGLCVHEGMERGLRGGSESEILEAVSSRWFAEEDVSTFDKEQNLALAQALCLGWWRSRAQEFFSKYEVLSVEEEIRVPLASNILLQARCDAVVRERSSGMLWVFNWKTTSSPGDWTDQWKYDVQSMTEALAAQEHHGEYVQGCIFEGFIKGSKYKGVSTSPLITGYTDGHVWEAGGKARTKDWKKVSIWKEFPGGIPAWLSFLGALDVSESYIRSYPILKNDGIVQDYLRQLVKEETDNQMMLDPEVSEDDRLLHFRQKRGKQCKWCSFSDSCWLGVPISELPLVPRRAHHTGGLVPDEVQPVVPVGDVVSPR